MTRKSMFALLAFSAVAVMAFGLSSFATAAGVDDSITCQLNGTTTDLTDIHEVTDPAFPTGGHGIYDFESSPVAPGVTCLHLDNDVGAAVSPDSGGQDSGVWTGDINSTGSYQNIRCGTGHAHGHPWEDRSPGEAVDPGEKHFDDLPIAGPSLLPTHATTIRPSVSDITAVTAVVPGTDGGPAGNNDSPVDMITYEIDFSDGQGVLTINEGEDGDGDTVQLSDAGPGKGVINIDPQPADASGVGCVTTEVTGFDVHGAFTASTGH